MPSTRGTFREDLYYRLQVFDILMPPLRERTRDIPLLAEAFLRDIGRAIGRPPAGLTPEAKEMLMKYTWPGNVRELRNVLERATILCEGGTITPDHLSLHAEPDRPVLGTGDGPARGGAPGNRESAAGDGREQGEDRPAPGPHAHAALRPAPQVRHRSARRVVAESPCRICDRRGLRGRRCRAIILGLVSFRGTSATSTRRNSGGDHVPY